MSKTTKNNYFKFKQFLVNQDKTAMKVSTDACIFGAIANCFNAENILDIGTGTGLLSLFVAQRFPHSQIHAVELDQESFEQAKENFKNSPFSSRLDCFHNSIQNFALQTPKQYDFIISNPPFFENQLVSFDAKKAQAWHTVHLSQFDLLHSIDKLLKPDGRFALLLPPTEVDNLTNKLIDFKFYINSKILIRHKNSKNEHVCILQLSRVYSDLHHSFFTVKNDDNSYTDEFINALSEFYLYL